MKLIPLTRGQFAKVDDWNYQELNKYNWQAASYKGADGYYAVRKSTININGVTKKITIQMSRQIMNTPGGLYCDHINHDTLDNQEHNLRNVTNSQNMMNRKGAQANNKSTGILGINTHRSRFRATITVNGKIIHLKSRETIEGAIKDRKEAEIKYFGEFANKT